MEVASDQAFPRIHQLAFFLPNRVGALLRVVDALASQDIEIRAISVLDAHDHAVARLIVDRPVPALDLLRKQGYSTCTSELVAVALEAGQSIGTVLSTLLRAELNVHYTYALLQPHRGLQVLALHVDNLETATRILLRSGFPLVDQRDLEKE